MTPLLDGWKYDLKKVRLARKGISEAFLDPFDMHLPEEAANSVGTQQVIDLVVRIFPFMLVMWSLAGALYPAVDLCAGEKERGTMETLLISPAGREEIVLGKFLTIWIFSSGSALLNLLSMGISTTLFASYMPQGGISIAALLWCVVLSLPQSAFFSRDQPGNWRVCPQLEGRPILPDAALRADDAAHLFDVGAGRHAQSALRLGSGDWRRGSLMQKLMTAANLSDIPWGYFVPVLPPIGLYSWLGNCAGPSYNSNREEVLFREAERFEPMLWLRRLLREQGAGPDDRGGVLLPGVVARLVLVHAGAGARLAAGDAYGDQPVGVRRDAGAVYGDPSEHASSRWVVPAWRGGRDAGLAALLALLLLPVLTGLTQTIALSLPHLLDGVHPLLEILRALNDGTDLTSMQLLRYLLAFALLPALCEEVAFRGFVRGLHHGYRPRNAVLLTSFFFALFHMNVFLFLPTFLFGVVLGLPDGAGSRSLLPAILFHFLHNSVLIALIQSLSRLAEGTLPNLVYEGVPWLIGLCVVAATAARVVALSQTVHRSGPTGVRARKTHPGPPRMRTDLDDFSRLR